MSGATSMRGSGARRGLVAGALVAVTSFSACGGQSQRHDAGAGAVGGVSGGVGGSTAASGGSATGATPGAGGRGIGGSPGRGCPPVAPRAFVSEACPSGLTDAGCRYALECTGGPRELTYRCGAAANQPTFDAWSVEDQACEHPYEFCTGGDAQVRCYDGSWQLLGGGGDGPVACSPERPVEGTSCPATPFSGPAVCGYPCPGGAGWTVASCFFAAGPTWLYDGACPGDCGGFEQALHDYVVEHSGCETDDDCQSMVSACAFSKHHCSGAFALNRTGTRAEFEALDGALTACASENERWSCATCNAVPPAPRCVEGSCSVR